MGRFIESLKSIKERQARRLQDKESTQTKTPQPAMRKTEIESTEIASTEKKPRLLVVSRYDINTNPGKGVYERVTASDHGVVSIEGVAGMATAYGSGSTKVEGYVYDGRASDHGHLTVVGNIDKLSAYASGSVEILKNPEIEKYNDKEGITGNAKEVSVSNHGFVLVEGNVQVLDAFDSGHALIKGNVNELRVTNLGHAEVMGDVNRIKVLFGGTYHVYGKVGTVERCY